jgi:hypothetical protein
MHLTRSKVKFSGNGGNDDWNDVHTQLQRVQKKSSGVIQRKVNDGGPWAEKSTEEQLADLKAGKYDDDPQAKYEIARKILIENFAHLITLSLEDQQFLIAVVSEAPQDEPEQTSNDASSERASPQVGFPSEAPYADTDANGALEKIKSGKYSDNPEAELATAKRLLIEDMVNPFLSEEDKQLLISIITGTKAENEPDTKTTESDKTTDAILASNWEESKVKAAAWKIVNAWPQVKSALLIYGGIGSKKIVPEGEQNAELEKFFNSGPYEPRIESLSGDGSAETPPQSGKEPHQVIQINPRLSFSVAVSRYLHEMNHYMDKYYNGETVPVDLKKDQAEGTGGIANDTLLSEDEQLNSFGEFMNPLIERILSDMQNDPVPNEHPRVAALRAEFRSPDRLEKNDKKFISAKRKALRDDAVIKYEAWGATKELGGNLFSTGVELGFAFDKAAHGFFEAGKTDWAHNFDTKFEEKYNAELKQ